MFDAVEIVGDIGRGFTLGPYELLVPIASGGMASVWAARPTGTDGAVIVAVKFMLAELLDDVHFEKMFLDEAELASRIKHPNVVEILDVGEQDGVLYQVFEWVDGEPLNQLMREVRDQGGVPIPLMVRILAQACAGLHAAHELTDEAGQLVGLVHRDVSPQNLLIDYAGQLKVVDFGVAKAASNRQQTTVGQMKGKAAYMAPEQAMSAKIDRRTDVFALGIVLFQLVTGKHPFRADSDLATLGRIIAKQPSPRASSLRPDLPPEIDEICATAMSKDASGRFANMAEMLAALECAVPQSATVDDLGAFMQHHLGARGDKRRQSIREALRMAGERTPRVPSIPDDPETDEDPTAPQPPSRANDFSAGNPDGNSPRRNGDTEVVTEENPALSVNSTVPPVDSVVNPIREVDLAALAAEVSPFQRRSQASTTIALVVVGVLVVFAVGVYVWGANDGAEVPTAPG